MNERPGKSSDQQPPDRDERVSIPLDPEEALRGLLKTPPESEDPETHPPTQQ